VRGACFQTSELI